MSKTEITLESKLHLFLDFDLKISKSYLKYFLFQFNQRSFFPFFFSLSFYFPEASTSHKKINESFTLIYPSVQFPAPAGLKYDWFSLSHLKPAGDSFLALIARKSLPLSFAVTSLWAQGIVGICTFFQASDDKIPSGWMY